MKDKKVIKKIIIGLLVVIVLMGLYSVFVPSKDDTQSGSSLTSLLNSSVLGQVQETDIALANGEILRVLGSIENINLDDDIFSNPVFRLLKDSRFSIANPARIGRENPFLPSGFDAIAAAQANQQGFDQGSTSIQSGSFDRGEVADGFFDASGEVDGSEN